MKDVMLRRKNLSQRQGNVRLLKLVRIDPILNSRTDDLIKFPCKMCDRMT